MPTGSDSSKRNANRIVTPILFGAVIVVVGWTYLRGGGPGGGGLSLLQSSVGEPVPSFRAASLNGEIIRFPDDYRDKVVLVDFWATWCGPCVAEVPHLVDVYERFHGQGFEIVGISLDGHQGVTDSSVRSFVEKHEMKWEIIYAGAGVIAGEWGVTAVPAPFLVDGSTGKLLAVDAQLRGDALEQTIARAISDLPGR